MGLTMVYVYNPSFRSLLTKNYFQTNIFGRENMSKMVNVIR